MVPLGDLGELHLVADEDEVAGGEAHRDGVGEGDLAGLVDDEVVEAAGQLLAAEEPGGPADEARAGVESAGHLVVLEDPDDAVLHQLVVLVVADLVETRGDAGCLQRLRDRADRVA